MLAIVIALTLTVTRTLTPPLTPTLTLKRGEGGLALNQRLGSVVPECADTSLASTTAVQALSHSGVPLPS